MKSAPTVAPKIIDAGATRGMGLPPSAVLCGLRRITPRFSDQAGRGSSSRDRATRLFVPAAWKVSPIDGATRNGQTIADLHDSAAWPHADVEEDEAVTG